MVKGFVQLMLNRFIVSPASDRAPSGDKKSEGPIYSTRLTRPLRPQLSSQFSLGELRRLSKTFFLSSELPDGNSERLSHTGKGASTFLSFFDFFSGGSEPRTFRRKVDPPFAG